MSLNYELGDVKDYETVCFEGKKMKQVESEVEPKRMH